MIDPLYLAVFVACLVVVGALAYGAGLFIERQRATDIPPAVPATLYDELADLRHLKAQLDHPPQQHEHIWPREPDIRKMGWMRFHCTYANCPAVAWRPK